MDTNQPNETNQETNEVTNTNQQPVGFSSVQDEPEAPLKHSGLGIASFIVSLISITLTIVGLVLVISEVSVINENFSQFNKQITEQEAIELLENYPGLITGVLLLMFTCFMMLIGTILGVISLFQNRKKIFPVLGTVINVLPLVIVILIIAIGM